MATDKTYQPLIHKANGGDKLVVESGGEIELLSGSTITRAVVSTSGAATLAVTAALHAGRTILLNKAGGVDVTLPAATGTGNIYRFVVAAALSSDTYTIAAAGATDYFRGNILQKTDADGTANVLYPTANSGTAATESDKITVNGSTQGGIVGDWVEVQDIATAIWSVYGVVTGSASEATPFSVT